MKLLSQTPIENKRVLLRVDYNVSLTKTHTISDDERIRQSLPTLKDLLSRGNRVIIVTHLGRPEGRDETLSLKPVQGKLQEYLKDHQIVLITDFLKDEQVIRNQTKNEILLLENIRFYKEEKANDKEFSQKLSALADVYVNDAFSVDHREAASTVGVTAYLPSIAGLALEEEISYLKKVLHNPQKPFVAITGGGKISTKLTLLEKLLSHADNLLVGGGIANTILKANGNEIGQSICEDELLGEAKKLISMYPKQIILPTDVVVWTNNQDAATRAVDEIKPTDSIRDIGPKTRREFSEIIAKARTILWNGPVGNFEHEPFEEGTNALYKAVTQNKHALSIVGGGDTIAALAHHKDFHQAISHISTGGGAMLSFLQEGTLPAIDALEKNTKTMSQ